MGSFWEVTPGLKRAVTLVVIGYVGVYVRVYGWGLRKGVVVGWRGGFKRAL